MNLDEQLKCLTEDLAKLQIIALAEKLFVAEFPHLEGLGYPDEHGMLGYFIQAEKFVQARQAYLNK